MSRQVQTLRLTSNSQLDKGRLSAARVDHAINLSVFIKTDVSDVSSENGLRSPLISGRFRNAGRFFMVVNHLLVIEAILRGVGIGEREPNEYH